MFGVISKKFMSLDKQMTQWTRVERYYTEFFFFSRLNYQKQTFNKGYRKAPLFQLSRCSAVPCGEHACGADCTETQTESCRKAVICEADIAKRRLSVILSCYVLSRCDKRSTRGICSHRKYTRITSPGLLINRALVLRAVTAIAKVSRSLIPGAVMPVIAIKITIYDQSEMICLV